MACAIWFLSLESTLFNNESKHFSSPSLYFHLPSCSSISPSFDMFKHQLEAILMVADLPTFVLLLSLLSSHFFLCNLQWSYRVLVAFRPTKLLLFSQKLQNFKFPKFPTKLFLQA